MKTEKEEGNSIGRIFRDKKLIYIIGELVIFPHMKKGEIEVEMMMMLGF